MVDENLIENVDRGGPSSPVRGGVRRRYVVLLSVQIILYSVGLVGVYALVGGYAGVYGFACVVVLIFTHLTTFQLSLLNYD